MATEEFFSDLDLDFTMHPFNRDISKKINEYAIARSIRNLVLTDKYERAFHPEIGGGIRELLFEPADIVTVDSIKTKVKHLIITQEPRVKNVSVSVNLSPDQQTFECTVYFTPINNRQQTSITLYLKRVR